MEYVVAGRSTDGGLNTVINFAKRKGGINKLKIKKESFKTYEVDAVVKKVSSHGTYVVISKGVISGVREGMMFDFYYFDFLGGNKLIGTGKAVRVGSKKSIIKILSKISKRRIKEGIIARGGQISN